MSVDNQSEIPKDKSPLGSKMTRRDFLKESVKKIEQFGAAGVTAKLGLSIPFQPPSFGNENKIIVGDGEQMEEDPIRAYVNSSALFRNCSRYEKKKAEEIINSQYDKDTGEDGKEKKIQRVKELRNNPNIDYLANITGFHVASPFRRLIYPLIYVESSGEEAAVGGGTDFGLCQIQMPTAKRMLEKLRDERNMIALNEVQVGADERPNLKDPATNVILALEYLNSLYRAYPDYSLALWAYNLGEGNMYKAVETYLREDAGLTDSEINNLLNKVGKDKKEKDEIFAQRQEKFRRLGLNYIKLTSSKAVMKMFEEMTDPPIKPSTFPYVSKIASADMVLEEAENI
ncbi:MAG: transglycosylase SLT domain-containing protein [bacterium]|nr:transglycosylase SLT domain-containing protein [bacterium]